MATRRQPPPARTAEDDPSAAAGRDDSIEQALARSREIRKKGDRQIQAARERAATVRRRSGPSARSGPVTQDAAAGLIGVDEEIERTRQTRARLAELAVKLAQTEETVAHIHDEMAGRDARHAAQYRRAADDARQAARRARYARGGFLHNGGCRVGDAVPGGGWGKLRVGRLGPGYRSFRICPNLSLRVASRWRFAARAFRARPLALIWWAVLGGAEVMDTLFPGQDADA